MTKETKELPEDQFIALREDLYCLADYFMAAIMKEEENETKLKQLWKQQIDIILSRPYPYLPFTSTDLLLISHDEWKRREERKHIHEEKSWQAGWIEGFLTSKEFAKEMLDKIKKQGEKK